MEGDPMFAALLLLAVQAAPTQTDPVWDSVAATLKAAPAPGTAYHRYGFPRSDLSVRVGDVTVATGLALGGWAGFTGTGTDAAAIGDLVVRPDELAGVSGVLTAHGLTVSAIHNHLSGESPEIVYLHFVGEGPAPELARAIDAALGATATPRGTRPGSPAPLAIDTTLIFNGLGLRGRASGAVANLTAQLVREPVRVGHHDLPAAMAAASPINLQAVSPDRIVATGDFAVLAETAPALIQSLQREHVTVTAVHSHFITSAPAIVYIHFWADGTPPSVIKALRAALDAAHP